jgi:hypothetical protein
MRARHRYPAHFTCWCTRSDEVPPIERFSAKPRTDRAVSLQLMSGFRNAVERPEGNVVSD